MGIDLSSIKVRKEIAAKPARRYLLDSALVCALADHESCGWNTWAIRYEPAFFSRYVQPLLIVGKPLNATEAIARATSWGLCQVMGQTARELGFTGEFLAELCDPEIGLEFGCKKLRQCFDACSTVEGALLRYNGGSNPLYPDNVKSLMAKYF